jgi:hypothetical protein
MGLGEQRDVGLHTLDGLVRQVNALVKVLRILWCRGGVVWVYAEVCFVLGGRGLGVFKI